MNVIRIVLFLLFFFATLVGGLFIIAKAFDDPWILFPFAVAGCGLVTYFLAKVEE